MTTSYSRKMKNDVRFIKLDTGGILLLKGLSNRDSPDLKYLVLDD